MASDASFLYDWTADPDLRYDASFSELLVREDGGMYEVQAAYVRKNIDSDALRQKYHADNVVYFFLFNTPYGACAESLVSRLLCPARIMISNTSTCISASETYLMRRLRPMPMRSCMPSVRRTSIMWTRASHRSLSDYCSQTGCNDIMFTVNAGETIDNDFTPIDAYYVGIGARPAEADEWGLGPSEYDEN